MEHYKKKLAIVKPAGLNLILSIDGEGRMLQSIKSLYHCRFILIACLPAAIHTRYACSFKVHVMIFIYIKLKTGTG
jgi:hypothetical protein